MFKLFILSILALNILPKSSGEDLVLKTGSKKFTESVVLGELLAHLVRSTGVKAVHRPELGGTRVLWNGLLAGEIDMYVEYTGTISQEILSGKGISTEDEIRKELRQLQIRMSRPLGFNNTYAIGMKEEVASKMGIRTVSDLVKHPELALGFSNEFMDRGDGWPSLREKYKLPHINVNGMDHDLAYRGLEAGSIQAIDLYSTDADIEYYKLRVLEDDLKHFPAYHAVIIFREDLIERAPQVVSALEKLQASIPEKEMVKMNARAKLQKIPESKVAADFLSQTFQIQTTVKKEDWTSRLLKRTKEHLSLVLASLLTAIIVSVPLGIVAAKVPHIGKIILSVVGIIQTIPSLALLVFMIPLLGLGGPPAIVALFLYSLLPIVRNTYAGLHDIPPEMRESAEALGLPPQARLWLIELPMASRSILAGIKTSAVINIGAATLGALIGAGGYGQPILTGIRLDDIFLILEGAVPAALLAIFAQILFDIVERFLVSEGLRLDRS